MDGNAAARTAWDANARFWDERMGEGNDFVNLLIWPAVERLLAPKPGDRLLDVACGNGLTSRRLARSGASVVAFDFSEPMIELARQKGNGIDYRVLDATDAAALMQLGEHAFDGALCNMALMDLADPQPLLQALSRLLVPGSAFVFSILHPCFNNPRAIQVAELAERDGEFRLTYAIKISDYLTPYQQFGRAMHDQPAPHPYFHRPLSAIVGMAAGAGFVLDALEERAFPPGYSGGTTALSWNGNFSEIPPILAARFRAPGVSTL